MRRNLKGWLVLGVLFSSLVAFAKDEPPPPPPPPPPPAEESSSSNAGGGGLNGTDGLFDASSKSNRKQMLSFFLGLPYGGAYYSGLYGGGFPFGVGARFYLPIVANGFIPSLNDSFGIEFGADANFYFGGYGGTSYGFAIPVEARWNFHLLPKVEAYGKLGFALGFYIPAFGNLSFYPYAIAQVGIMYMITPTIALRAEVGYPHIKVGIGIAL
jgi:hypothetical protein